MSINTTPMPTSGASRSRRPQKEHEKDLSGFPWLIRPVSGSKVELKLPFHPANRAWLKSGFGTGLKLREKLVSETNSWRISKAHFKLAAKEMARRYDKVEVYMQFSQRVRCNTNCQDAQGDHCYCSCLGRYHGHGVAPGQGWKINDEVVLMDGIVEVHSTLFRGHTMDGMFA